MSEWPPIPTLVRGTGGAIKVRRLKKVKSAGVDCWGDWDDSTRTIRLDKTAVIEHQWRVLFHELAHAALHDSGLQNAFEDRAIEALCDAFATSRVQEMKGELGIIDC